MKFRLIALLLCCLVTLSPCNLVAQSLLTGSVVDSASGSPIGGASIRINGTTRGTYTRSNGTFRLPLTEGATTLNVRSVGYKESTITLTDAMMITVRLASSSVDYRSVNVVADITPEEIIRRAAARTKENAARITTITQTLYNKMKVIVNTPGLATGGPPQERITETFSKVYDQRQPERVKRIHILQRRQTANISASSNLAAFDGFFDFTEPEFVIIKTRLVTPLAENAIDEYNYTLVSKRLLGNKMVYELAFEPKSRLFPGFEGTLSIVEENYQVIAASFKPTDETAIPFLKGLKFEQRYEQLNDSMWVPMYQQMAGQASINIITGLISVDADVTAVTHVTDVVVNEPIADSLLHPDTSQIVRTRPRRTPRGVSVSVSTNDITTVAEDADTNRSEFWETHAFAESTEDEREIYRRQDSIVRNGDTNAPAAPDQSSGSTFGLFSIGPVGFFITPLLNRSSITGVMYGAAISTNYDVFTLTTGAAFGGEGTKSGQVEMSVRAIESGSVRLDVMGSVESAFRSVQQKRTILKRFESLNLDKLLYTDYFDYYRADGTDLGIRLRYDAVALSVLGGWYRHINMPLIETVHRTVLSAETGDYQTIDAGFEFGISSLMRQIFGNEPPVSGQINASWVRQTESKRTYGAMSASITGRIPTFSTGYTPMQLVLNVSGGLASYDTPRQFQFDFMRRFNILGTLTDLMTVPINAYGGTEFLMFNVDHNFTDLWWRAIGLPTYNGRGIDLIGKFNAAIMTQNGTPVVPNLVYSSTPGWYMEAGFGVSRIPTFISDVFFLRFDAMWPVGGVALPRGSFGWTIGVSSPLL